MSLDYIHYIGYTGPMSLIPPQPTTVMSVRIPADLARAMVKVHAHVGIAPAEQVRRALRAWLIAQGAMRTRVHAPKKVVPLRKRRSS
jgi:hypothetical protein